MNQFVRVPPLPRFAVRAQIGLAILACFGCHQGSATAHIQIARTAPGANTRTLEQAEYSKILHQQVPLAKSLIVIQEALTYPGMASQPSIKNEQGDLAIFLQERMNVVVSEKDESMQISTIGNNDEEAGFIALALAKAYLGQACARERKRTAAEYYKTRASVSSASVELVRLLALRKRLESVAPSGETNDQKTESVLEKEKLDKAITSKQHVLDDQSKQLYQLEMDLRAEDRYSLVSVRAGNPPKVVYPRSEAVE